MFAVLLSLFAVSQSAYAKWPVNTDNIEQERIIQQKARLQNLSVRGGKLISASGAVFYRDTSNPALGEAYRDPSGLIWGDVVMDGQGIDTMDQHSADEYCKSRNARLPTKEEYEQLTRYLGRSKEQGYSPFLTDGITDYLPLLTFYWEWTSSVTKIDDYYYAYAFYGKFGRFAKQPLPVIGAYGAARCVDDR